MGPNEQRLAQERSAARDRANTPAAAERERQLRIIARNQSTVMQIEHPTTGERLTIGPNDFATWREKGWRRYVEPLPDS